MKQKLLSLFFTMLTCQFTVQAQTDPIVTISTSASSISELEQFDIIATIGAPATEDIEILLDFSGSATYNQDFGCEIKTEVSNILSTQGVYPSDIFVDKDGSIYICEPPNSLVRKLSPGTTEGVVVAGGNGPGNLANQLSSPEHIFVDDLGAVYVSDSENYRIQKWLPGAIEGITVAGGNGFGPDLNQLTSVSDIFVNSEEDVIILMNNRVLQWGKNAVEGKVVLGSYYGENAMQNFMFANAMFVDAENAIYIFDSQEGTVTKWNKGDLEGTTVAFGYNFNDGSSQYRNRADLFIDEKGTVYVSERVNDGVKKWNRGTKQWSDIRGDTSIENQLTSPIAISVDSKGDIYILESKINQQVQKYTFSPVITILAGQTSARLTATIFDDGKDEIDELITIFSSVNNATISNTESVNVTIQDINDSPTVSFEFSEESIVENAMEEVLLTATLSVVSGKDILINFDVSGTATVTEEYVLSANSITIPAGRLTATLAVNTKDLDDSLVEITETIVFNITSIESATSELAVITLNLESDDDPTVSYGVSKTSFTEHEKFTITATLDAATSKEVVLPFEFSGTAVYDQDFSCDTKTMVTSILSTQGFYVSDISVDKEGNIYTCEPGESRVRKWNPSATEAVTVAGGVGQGDAANQLSNPQRIFVDDIGNVYVWDSQNYRIQKWVSGATEGITVAGGNGSGYELNKIGYLQDFYVTETESIYVLQGGVQIWEKDAQEGRWASIDGVGADPLALFVDKENSLFILSRGNNNIKKWKDGEVQGHIVAGGQGYGSELNQLKEPSDIFVDDLGSLYIADSGNNRVLKWGLDELEGVNITDVASSPEGQMSSSQRISLNAKGDLYVLDNEINQRIQKYTYIPQIAIPAGTTSASLIIKGIDDNKDEEDEIIRINAIASNAILATSDVDVTIIDVNDPPTVSFEFSEESIVENALEEVFLTATLSAVSGKEIVVSFDVSGTATVTDEYTLSSKSITIPAGKISATLGISTKELDDSLVEILETIVFNVASIENAASESIVITLNLESDDDPSISYTVSKNSFAEHENFTITATIDAATSKEVVLPFVFSGTAVYDQDFICDVKTEVSIIEGMNEIHISDIVVDKEGYIYTCETYNAQVRKWSPDGSEVVIVAGGNDAGSASNQLNYPIRIFVDDYGNVFVSDSQNQRIQKWEPGASEGTTVAGGNGYGNALNQLYFPRDIHIDSNNTIYILDYSNNRIVKWKEGDIEGEVVLKGEENGVYHFSNPTAMFMDDENSIYLLENGRNEVKKWSALSSVGEVIINWDSSFLADASDFFIDNNGSIFITDRKSQDIMKWIPGEEKGTIITNSEVVYNTPDDIPFTINTQGDLFKIERGEVNSVKKYTFTPQIAIPAGATSATITVSGVEDEINEEGEELISIASTNVSNAILTNATPIEVVLLDNSKTISLQENPFIGLSNGAVAWGDFDRDGDQDVAVMGQSNITGAVTSLYENRDGVFVDTNQDFVKLYGGDISWVDINKDGWIDLVVSGFNGTPQTNLYINKEGRYFELASNYNLPQLYSSSMAWGDLDNDGDIDLAMSGIDETGQYIFSISYWEPLSNSFVLETANIYGGEFQFMEGFINGDLKIVDVDLDGDNDIVYSGENGIGNPMAGIKYNTFIDKNNGYYNDYLPIEGLKESTVEVLKLNKRNNYLTVLVNGVNYEGINAFYKYKGVYESAPSPGYEADGIFPKLKNGDIAVGDFDNNGTNDLLFTGETQDAIPTTKLFLQGLNGSFKESELVLEGLRESTANFVDYDMDGDLDIFLSGSSSSGAKTLLYKSEIANKKNTAPQIISGLQVEDLGNGKVKFTWDTPSDDFSDNLGYVLRLGITPGGTELSNTESDLLTGTRLITKSAPIYSNFYETQLDPGNYFWAVQAIDTGLKGGVFSEEASFVHTYEWKELNQGGIVDRKIAGYKDAVIKLVDLDNDNDLDLLFTSSTSYGSQLLKYDGRRLIKEETNVFDILSNIKEFQVGDINGDGTSDILVNGGGSNNSTSYLNLFISHNGTYVSSTIGEGLFNSKSRILDLNNDGTLEIIHIGNSTNTLSGVPKILLFEDYNNQIEYPNFNKKTDVSPQIKGLKFGSFDLGDYDNDQDIDFTISGFNDSNGLQSYIYENVSELGGDFTLSETAINLAAVRDGTTDFIDFDSDGDLDVIYTGTSTTGDVFEIYMNKLNEGITTWQRLDNLGLPPMRNSKIDLGDINGDGYSDLLYSGVVEGIGKITKLSEFDPATNTFKESSFDVSQFMDAELEFGDIDGDGDLDFVIAGENKLYPGNYIFKAYINVRNQSAVVLEDSNEANSNGIFNKGVSGKSTYVVNKAPTAPLPLAMKAIEGMPVDDNGTAIELSWLPGKDDFTPEKGLTYALKIGRSEGAEDIMSVNANVNGSRKLAGKGNVEHNLKWQIRLPKGKYFWSVQAIDASFNGSVFSSDFTFEITETGASADSDNDGVIDKNDQCLQTPEGEQVDDNGCSESQLDDDGDGVMNNVDSCIETPQGEIVNDVGCAESQLDDDGDGVMNNLDSCIETPQGEIVNDAGCAESQLDDDGDGIMNNMDLCPNSVDGSSVNENGCSEEQLIQDDDGDTVPNIIDLCANTPNGSTVDLNGCVLLPSNNFSIQVSSETCTNTNNGEISISAVTENAYTLQVNDKTYQFNDVKIIDELAPGVYSICIEVVGLTGIYCYEVTVDEAAVISGKSSAKNNEISFDITQGTAPFEIYVNGAFKFKTIDESFSVEVLHGDFLEVYSAKLCEGTLERSVDLSDNLVAYPNPTEGFFELTLPTLQQEVQIAIFSIDSQFISRKVYPVNYGKVEINIDNLSSGVYIIKVESGITASITVVKK